MSNGGYYLPWNKNVYGLSSQSAARHDMSSDYYMSAYYVCYSMLNMHLKLWLSAALNTLALTLLLTDITTRCYV